ncbi:DUF3429 domain-containing protein [Glaciimonas soli]|uniref:DUF3429 family protein n=1 Tax=Glaciimonas soli TaxID=2590999 RepID=A0A843YXL3_9BURK|nr:DUF3429 domain-containing protein [Glaciimonas soli]MQR02208.1 DUF3429 family protein [Glaciimonas soli]
MNPHFLNQRLIRILGYVGLIPFVLLTMACWLGSPDWVSEFIHGEMAYGVAALSFLGGIHWGAMVLRSDLSAERTRKALIWGVMPTVIAWCSTLFFAYGFPLLMLGFVAAYQVDKRLFVWYGLPTWFTELRYRLTCISVGAMVLSMIAAVVRGNFNA